MSCIDLVEGLTYLKSEPKSSTRKGYPKHGKIGLRGYPMGKLGLGVHREKIGLRLLINKGLIGCMPSYGPWSGH